MAHWWLADLWKSDPSGPMIAISWVFWVIFSICCHELGHGYAAIRKGDDTPIALGHITWNPLVHMGPQSLLMLLLCGISWGAMPVNPNRMRGKYAEAYVAAAGPSVNMGLFLTCAVLAAIWAVVPRVLADAATENIRIFLRVGCALNIILMLFNLIPVPPLDGSRILANFYRPYAEFVYSGSGQVITLIAFILLFFFGGSYVQSFGFHMARTTVGALTQLLRSIFHITP